MCNGNHMEKDNERLLHIIELLKRILIYWKASPQHMVVIAGRWAELDVWATEMLEGVAVTARHFRLHKHEERGENRKFY